MAKLQSTSAYAQGLGKILSMPEPCLKDFTQNERAEFLINLQILETLNGPVPFGKEGQQQLAALTEVGRRLDKLQELKQQLEQ